MTPEELEAFRLNIAINEPSQVVLEEKALRLIDRQAARITKLEAQVAALKEIAVEGHAKEIYPFIMPMWKHLPEEDTWIDDKLFGKSKQVGKSTYRYHARSQLAEEHPEAFR
jgi:hypothetical protein